MLMLPVLADQIEDCIRYRLWGFVPRQSRGCRINRYAVRHFAFFQETPELTPRITLQIMLLDVGPSAVKGRELSIDVFLLGCSKFSCRAVVIYIDELFTWFWHSFSWTERGGFLVHCHYRSDAT